ncbi:PAS domain S-box protein, partial [Thermodesulfobacteriota bacterium]
MGKLHVLKGAMEGQIYDVGDTVISIGRSAENDIQITDKSLSRMHARILQEEDKFFIEDLNSQNGTWVNGERITPGNSVEILEGHPVALGKVLISLGEEYALDGMLSRYSINLSQQTESVSKYSFHRDRRLTARRDLELLHEVSTILMQSLHIDEICRKIMDALLAHFKRIDGGSIILVDQDSGELKEVMTAAKNRKNGQPAIYSRTIVNRVLQDGKAVMMSDTSREAAEDLSDSIMSMRIKSIMCVPLISKSGARGVIYVHSIAVPHGFRKEDLFLLTALSSPAAVAIENALLFSKSKLSEEALRKSKERYQHLYNNALVGLYRVGIADGKLLECNERFCQLFGYHNQEQILQEFVLSRHHAENGVQKELYKELLDAGEVSNAEASLKRRDGTSMWAKYSARIFRNEGYVEGSINDITDHKMAETAFHESEKRFREMAELLPQPIYEIDLDGKLTFLSRSGLGLSGYDQDDMEAGLHAWQLFILEDRQRFQESFQKTIKGENLGGTEHKALRKDGSVFPVIIHSAPIMGENEPIGVRGVMIDITQQKKLESQLLQAHKMEAIGTLAGGISHDFNNILQTISGYTQMLMMLKSPADPEFGRLGQIEKAARRANELTRQLLIFSRKIESELRPVDLNQEVIQVTKMLQSTIPKMIKI